MNPESLNLFLDLETYPSTLPDAKKDLEERLAKSLKPSSRSPSMKQLKDDRAGVVEAEWRKQALDGTYGEIGVLAWAFNDEPVEAVYRSPKESERHMLEEAFALINQRIGRRIPCFIGHNVRQFDLKFLWHRCVVLDLKPPFRIPWTVGPGDDRIYDTMERWSGGYGAKSTKLDNLAKALGLDGKGDIDGSMVWDAVQDGKLEEVVKYCQHDVELVREVWKRMTFS